MGQSTSGAPAMLGGALVLIGVSLLAVGYIGRRRPAEAGADAES